MKPPVIICPFSRTGDEVAGETASEVALNLAPGTRVFLAVAVRKTPARPVSTSVWEWFFGHTLSPEARAALKYVEEIYRWYRPRSVAEPELNFGKAAALETQLS